MRKILYLSLIVFPIFSMQLDLVSSKNKVNRFQEKLSKQISNTDKVHIKPASVFAPNHLGSVELYHGKKGFSVIQDDKKHIIKKYFTDPMVRDITKKQLKSFLKGGYFSLNQMDDGEFSLKTKGRIVGGGPLFGTAAYWITKSLCYAVGFAAIGGTVVTTGGAAVGLATYATATAGGVALTTAAITTTSAAAIGTTTGVVVGTVATGASLATGAGIVGGAIGVASASGVTIAGATLGTAAATTTAAVVTGAGGIGATIAGVEAVSLAVGTFFGMLPTP